MAVVAAVASHRQAMREFAAMRDLDLWHTQLNVVGILNRGALRRATRTCRLFTITRSPSLPWPTVNSTSGTTRCSVRLRRAGASPPRVACSRRSVRRPS